MTNTNIIIDNEMEESQIHLLRVYVHGIKADGYSKEWTRKYLFDKFVHLDSYITDTKFEEILNEYYKGGY